MIAVLIVGAILIFRLKQKKGSPHPVLADNGIVGKPELIDIDILIRGTGVICNIAFACELPDDPIAVRCSAGLFNVQESGKVVQRR